MVDNNNLFDADDFDMKTHTAYNYSILITRTQIKSALAAEILEKPIGNYITIEPTAKADDRHISFVIAEEIRRILKIKYADLLLVVGIGNRHMTSDALGVRVAEKIIVTAHNQELLDANYRPVAAVVPNTMGKTGIESGVIIRGIIKEVKPKAVIVVDALCSPSLERLNSTIQITDTGIQPGAGLGNKCLKLDKETLGIPVIAIGVPTTVAFDVIDGKSGAGKYFCTYDIDDIVKRQAKIIANGINRAVGI